MFSFLCKNLLKISANGSLKSTPLCILNQTHRYSSHNVQPQITEKVDDSVVSVLKTYGFTQTQISTLLSKKHLSVGNRTKPKLDFFTSFGFSTSDIYHILAQEPRVVRSSLKNRIIPCCEFLKGILKDNASVIAAVKRSSRILLEDVRRSVGPNVELLRSYGMLDSRISVLVRTQPRYLIRETYRFKMLVEELKEMGFDPAKRHFVEAIQMMTGLHKSTRDRKWDLLRKWGLSNEEIHSAFLLQPKVVSTSEEKIERVMDFLVNKLGWDASKVSACPTILSHGLENWTKPRCFVIQFLLSKGVVKNLVLSSFISITEYQFKKRYVDKHFAEFPEVFYLYGSTEDTQRLQANKVSTLGGNIV